MTNLIKDIGHQRISEFRPFKPSSMPALLLTLILAITPLLTSAKNRERQEWVLDSIKLPPGFKIEYYADNVPEATSMTLSPSGVIFVGTKRLGKVYAIQDVDGDKFTDRVITVAEGLDRPNGVAYLNGDLFIAEISKISKIKDIENNLHRWHKPVIITDSLPKDRLHGTRYIAISPEGWLYIAVGAPCNTCVSPDPYATILRMQPDGSQAEIYARGVRYCLGMAFHPETHALWFTCNSRNSISDVNPGDELNCAPNQGMHFGHPYVIGDNIPDKEFEHAIKPGCRFYPPALKLEAHVNLGGLCFYNASQFPEKYQGKAFICEGGTTHAQRASGFKISVVDPKKGRESSQETFAEGWRGFYDEVLGRPTDILVHHDGSLLVSDSFAGCIYRISYNPDLVDVPPKGQRLVDNKNYNDESPHSPRRLPEQLPGPTSFALDQ